MAKKQSNSNPHYAPPVITNNNNYNSPRSINIGFCGSMDWDLPPEIMGQVLPGCYGHLKSFINSHANHSYYNELPLRIHVGDNPQGIDPMVIEYFTRTIRPRIHTAVYGVNHHWRNLHDVWYPSQAEWIIRITGATGSDRNIFYQRDAHMLKWIQVLYAVWNGKSSGTIAQYRAAHKHEKIVAFLVRYLDGQWVIDRDIDI